MTDREKEIENDARIDRWNNGALDALYGRPKSSTDREYCQGYLHGLDERKVRAVLPARPEGYYHMKLTGEEY